MNKFNYAFAILPCFIAPLRICMWIRKAPSTAKLSRLPVAFYPFEWCGCLCGALTSRTATACPLYAPPPFPRQTPFVPIRPYSTPPPPLPPMLCHFHHTIYTVSIHPSLALSSFICPRPSTSRKCYLVPSYTFNEVARSGSVQPPTLSHLPPPPSALLLISHASVVCRIRHNIIRTMDQNVSWHCWINQSSTKPRLDEANSHNQPLLGLLLAFAYRMVHIILTAINVMNFVSKRNVMTSCPMDNNNERYKKYQITIFKPKTLGI